MRRQNCHGLGVGLGSEAVAVSRQLMAQCLEILDDAVMDDGDPIGRDWMGIGLGRQTMGRPTGVADANHSGHRLTVEPPCKVDELALGAPALDTTIDQGGDTGRVIAAVFQPPEPFEKTRGHGLPSDDADDAAHQLFWRRSRERSSAARPGLSICRPRAIDSASAETSLVTTLPAATIAPSPTVTGATSAVFEPIKTPSPIIVRCLLKPS